jgi:hypothetical protein
MTALARCAVTVLVLVGLCVAPSAAFAQVPGEPPIDWSVRTTFIGANGEDIPLRIGQHDSPIRDGFGVRHILDGHDEIPDERDIGVVLSRSDDLCKTTSKDDRARCYLQIGDRGLVIVYTESVRGDAPDGRPTGVITAYYTPRGCPC